MSAIISAMIRYSFRNVPRALERKHSVHAQSKLFRVQSKTWAQMANCSYSRFVVQVSASPDTIDETDRFLFYRPGKLNEYGVLIANSSSCSVCWHPCAMVSLYITTF